MVFRLDYLDQTPTVTKTPGCSIGYVGVRGPRSNQGPSWPGTLPHRIMADTTTAKPPHFSAVGVVASIFTCHYTCHEGIKKATI